MFEDSGQKHRSADVLFGLEQLPYHDLALGFTLDLVALLSRSRFGFLLGPQVGS